MLTAVNIFIGHRLGNQERGIEHLDWIDAIAIGIAQAVAIVAEIYRSGSTIATGHARNLACEASPRYNFLLVTPLINEGSLVDLTDLVQAELASTEWLVLGIGFVVAMVSGYAVTHWFLRYLRTRPMTVFAAFCIIFLSICMLVFTLRGG